VKFLLHLLAQWHYQPFKKPAPIWDYWYLLLLPLCLAISIVYKSVRCESMRRVPRDALVLFIVIVVVMIASAGALAAIVELME
jgi:membrane protein YdbS with pleckstrin-like domain